MADRAWAGEDVTEHDYGFGGHGAMSTTDLDPRQRQHLHRSPWMKPTDCTCRSRQGAPYYVCRAPECVNDAQACGGYCPTCFAAVMDNARLSGEVRRKVEAERARQDVRWGEQNHTDEWWLAILTEEVGETAQALLCDRFGGTVKMTTEDELVQVAAVALAWLECMERRRG